MPEISLEMDATLTEIYNSCHPHLAATKEQYLDMRTARGDDAFLSHFRNELERSDSRHGFLHQVFSGHMGGGKSSELANLCRNLALPSRRGRKFLPVLMDTDAYLDIFDVRMTDILLAMVTQISQTLDQEGILIRDNLLQRLWERFARYLLTEVELKELNISSPDKIVGVSIPLPKIQAKIALISKSKSARTQVREALREREATLPEEINLFLEGVRLEVKKAGYHDIVLIVDNLEKIRKFSGQEEGEKSYEALFIEGGAPLQQINAHTLYTVPLTLVRSHASQLQSRYGCNPYVLPMVKVRQRNDLDALYEAGAICLRQLFAKRLPAGVVSTDVITREAQDFLILYSGGDTRSFVRSIQNVITDATEVPIPLAVAQRAIRRDISNMAAGVANIPNSWRKLAELEETEDRVIRDFDETYQALLRELYILEYINGDPTEGDFDIPKPWYAAHPIIRRWKEFQEEAEALRRERSATATGTAP